MVHLTLLGSFCETWDRAPACGLCVWAECVAGCVSAGLFLSGARSMQVPYTLDVTMRVHIFAWLLCLRLLSRVHVRWRMKEAPRANRATATAAPHVQERAMTGARLHPIVRRQKASERSEKFRGRDVSQAIEDGDYSVHVAWQHGTSARSASRAGHVHLSKAAHEHLYSVRTGAV